MSEKLKPCPFCGTDWAYFEFGEDYVFVKCATCNASSETVPYWFYKDEAKNFMGQQRLAIQHAREVWNMRAEKICTNLEKSGGFHCSLCGYKVRYDKYSLYPTEDDELNFCLHCGAKVVDE